MVKHTRSPSSEETSPSRGSKPKRAPASALAIATTSCLSAKRARGAQRLRLPIQRRSWALDYGLAGLIAERALAVDVSAYMSFRAVCGEWRRGTEDVPGKPQGCLDRRFHPRRWIMLREAVPPVPGRHCRRFLNLDTGQCVQTELPELDSHYFLGATTEGLLTLVNESTYVVRLLNPVTRQLAELPSLGSPLFAQILRRASESEVIVISLADDSTVALCLRDQLLVARPGDDRWRDVGYHMSFNSAISFAGRFYCATSSAVRVLEARADNNNKQWRLEVVAQITFRVPWRHDPVTFQLLESDGQLLLLRSWLAPMPLNCNIRTRKYQVYRVDLDAHKVVLLSGLRGRAVFVGEVRALSVSAGAFPSICSNTVYLGYDLSERIQKGAVAYNLHDRRITEYGNKEDDGWAWTRPCGIGEYLSWYVSGECGRMEEI